MKKIPIYYTYKDNNLDLPNSNRVYVKYCLDGDTFVGIKNGIEKKYRLANIDTPEKNTVWGIHAKVFLEHVIGRKNVYLTPFSNDKYGRTIANVYLDFDKTISVNNAIIKEGLSRAHNYSKVNGYNTENDFAYTKRTLMVLWATLTRKGIFGTVDSFYKNKPFSKPKKSF